MTDIVKPLAEMSCSDCFHKREQFEIIHLSLNLVEVMIELNDTRGLFDAICDGVAYFWFFDKQRTMT